jgi:hypothetical protein
MNAAAQRMVAEVLGRQLGMDAGELATALDADPIAAVFALSMMGQRQPQKHESDAAERLVRVATIVGACPLCLGENPLCTECLGEGRPGYRAPDREALLAWIALPLRRAGLCVTPLRREQ